MTVYSNILNIAHIRLRRKNRLKYFLHQIKHFFNKLVAEFDGLENDD